jgi:endoglycosylceramidase
VRRTRRAAAIAAVAAALGLLAAGAHAAPTAPLGHSGRWITDANGRVVILHGMNMVYKRPPYYPAAAGFGDDDAAFLQRFGFNSVRLGVIYKGVEPNPGAYDDAYLGQIAATEADLARHGIFSQLDFHQDLYNEKFQGEGWPDWAVQDDGLPNTALGFPTNYLSNLALNRAFDHFWANSPGPGGVGLQDRYAAAWAHVASRFASAQHTAGFDLLNEPWPGTPFATCLAAEGCSAFDQGVMQPFYAKVISRIRSVERQKLVWYEPNVLFNFGADSSITQLTDGQAGFSFHIYCTPGLAVPPYNLQSCEGQGEHVFQNADKHAQATGDALMVTEFGATDDLATIRSNVADADRHMVSWQYWHYCECTDPTTSGSGVQAVVVDPSQSPTGANVKQAKLDVLSEPYPQVVAGSPTSYGFDPAAKTFRLSYYTRGPGGRDFAPSPRRRRHRAAAARKKGSKKRRGTKSIQTQIFVGGDTYPGGYTASVTGGGIASKPGAALLRVLACPGRVSVDVTVRPASPGGRSQASCKVTRKKRKRR